jgi:hypothetical protein
MTPFTGLRGIPVTPSRQDRAVRRWRRAQLVAAGYDEVSAQRLASRGGLDLHALLDRREQRLSPPACPRTGAADPDRDRNRA